MGFWPFGGGKRQRMVEKEELGQETLLRRAPSDTPVEQEKEPGAMSNLGRTSSQQRREEHQRRRLSKTRTSSSKALTYTQPSRPQNAPTRTQDSTRHASRTTSQYNEKSLYQQNPLSQSSLGPENFTVVRSPPTLHAKRSENDSNIPRRKSSKRKAEDSAREREIRAMTSSPIPIPKRPATLYGSGPLQRDSRQIPGPLNRRLERPTSEISLPLAGSYSDIVSFQNQNSFKIGMLAALSPRPTVKYDANPKNAIGKQPMRPNMAIRQAIAEEDMSDRERIDDLADDLDAGGLRELMERDRRRRERKRDSERAKMQRKLQRRAERQREEEARRARTEAFVRSSPSDTPRKQGLGIESLTTAKEMPAPGLATSLPEDDPFSDPGPSRLAVQPSIPNPFEDETDLDVMNDPQESGNDRDELDSSPIPVRSPVRRVEVEQTGPREEPSHPTISPPVSPIYRTVERSSLSQGSLLNREATPENAESASLDRRASDQSSQRMSSWTTFFRRGTRRNPPGRGAPSEFSNTSRESFSRKQPPVLAPRTFRRSDSATPQRTMSRFREDLPEIPISPPDSRVQSPESTVPAAGSITSSDVFRADTTSMRAIPSNRDSSGLSIVEQLSSQQPKSSGEMDPLSISSGMILSQSLASVDSEGSWLSGRPSKRLSGQPPQVSKPSQSSLSRQMPGAFEQEVEDDIMDDEYYKRLSIEPQHRQLQEQQLYTARRASSGLLNLEPEEDMREVSEVSEPPESSRTDQAPMYHDIATLDPREARRTKSKEVLTTGPRDQDDESSSDDNSDDEDSATPDEDIKQNTVMRATSVEYKGHARHISAGSAKLLNISRGSIHSDSGRPLSGFQKSDPALQMESPPASPRHL